MSDGSDTSSLDLGERPELPRAGIWAALAAGLVAATLLPGSRIGLSILLVAVTVAAAVVTAVPRDVSAHEVLFGGLALALASIAVVRTADWVVAVAVLGAGGLATFAVTSARTWGEVVAGPLKVIAMIPWVPANIAGPVIERARRRGTAGLGTVFRTTGITIGLVVVFGTLFASADAAFARIANEVLVPDLEVGNTTFRIVVFGFVTAFAGGLALASPSLATTWLNDSSRSWNELWSTAPEKSRMRNLEWALPIAVLDVLFASFVAVQMTVLFGGRHHVELTPGLTYAEYARQGFFQLLAVAALVLLVVAVTVRIARPERSPDRRLVQLVLGGLCGLTLVVLASAWYRLGVYEEAYGLTRLRVSVYGAIAWLGGVFVLIMVAGALWRASWLPRVTVAVTAIGLLTFALINPDALIAERNVSRYQATGVIDLHYLGTLSEDAVPALVELPAEMRECLLAEIASDRGTREDRGWAEFNLSRARARGLLDRFDVPAVPPAGCLGG